MNKRNGSYPCVRASAEGETVVCQASGLLLTQTAGRTGLERALSAALAAWRKDRFVHDPGTGEPVAMLLRPGRASSNTAADT